MKTTLITITSLCLTTMLACRTSNGSQTASAVAPLKALSLNTSDIQAIADELSRVSRAGDVKTSVGTWRCVTGIVEKTCFFGEGNASIHIGRRGMSQLLAIVNGQNEKSSLSTSSGIWVCEGEAKKKSCLLAPKEEDSDTTTATAPSSSQQTIHLNTKDVDALIKVLRSPGRGEQIETAAGTWYCVQGIVEKYCYLEGSDNKISLSRHEGESLAKIHQLSSGGNFTSDHGGTWACTVDTNGIKSCTLNP